MKSSSGASALLRRIKYRVCLLLREKGMDQLLRGGLHFTNHFQSFRHICFHQQLKSVLELTTFLSRLLRGGRVRGHRWRRCWREQPQRLESRVIPARAPSPNAANFLSTWNGETPFALHSRPHEPHHRTSASRWFPAEPLRR